MSIEFNPTAEEKFQTILSRYPNTEAALLPSLFLAQEEFGWISVKVMDYLAQRLELPPSKVISTATFYTMYNKAPVGKCHIQVCTTLACAYRGGYSLLDKLEDRLGIGIGETSKDGVWTLSEVECLAACGGAPMFQVTDSSGLIEYYENIHTEEELDRILGNLKQRAESLPLPKDLQ